MEASDFSSINMTTSMACGAASTRTRTSSPYSLLNSQSVGHSLQETPGYLAMVEQLGHVFSARFAHPPPQTTVLHENQEVLGDVGHAGSVLHCPRVWKHDTMAIVDPVAFPEYRLTDLPLLCYLRQECRFTVDHRVETSHRVDRDHRLCAGVSLHLNHSETLQPRRCSVDIAGGQQVGHEIVRDHVGGVDDLLLDAQLRRQLEVDQVLLDRAGLRPNFADISPVGRLGINQGQRLHHLVVCRDITIGHEPWDGLHPKLLRV